MLWREPYDTQRLGDMAGAPSEGASVGTALIMVAGVAALPEFGVWIRLVESDFGPDAWHGVLIGDRLAFAEALPGSRLAQCEMVDSTEWPVVPGRILAGVVTDSGLRSVMVGPATEEAWDEFSAALRAA